MQVGFLFKSNKLCVPAYLLRELLVREAYGGSLVGHTLDILREHFYCKIGEDVHRVVSRCFIYHKVKTQFHQGLYTPVLVPMRP